MKGKIEKIKGFWGDEAYRITYDRKIWASEEANIKTLDIAIEDISGFMDEINKDWDKILTDKLNKKLKLYKRSKEKNGRS